MRRTRKAINNLSLRKNIIMRKAQYIKHSCTSRAQNDALEATLSHSAGGHIEKLKAQRKDILMRSVLHLCDVY